MLILKYSRNLLPILKNMTYNSFQIHCKLIALMHTQTHGKRVCIRLMTMFLNLKILSGAYVIMKSHRYIYTSIKM
jgi:hypothetical protein